MKKQILLVASILLVLVVCNLQTIDKSLAHSQVKTQIADLQRENQASQVSENIAYSQLFRMMNSFEKEAQKQENKGFASRAEALRGTFQKMLRLDDWQFGKLKAASSNFLDEASRLKSRAKKLNSSEISQAKKAGEMTKIENKFNQLPLDYRENLRMIFGSDRFERFDKSLQEKIVSRIRYRENPETHSVLLTMSLIEYDETSDEVLGYSTTDEFGGYDDIVNIVYATLTSDTEGIVDEASAEECNQSAEVYLYSSGTGANESFCIDGEHLYAIVPVWLRPGETNNDFLKLADEPRRGGGCYYEGTENLPATQDCLTVQIPNVTGITFQPIAANNLPIDANPNVGGGLRIFPDDNTPVENANRQTIRVTAGISEPIAGRTVYFRNFDVDDPSDDMTIDPNGNSGDDNNGRVNNQREGQLSAVSATTNSNGVATVDFTVTMQPGDNFAIAASTDQNQINAVGVSGTDLLNGQGQGISTSCDYTDSVCRSEMLTVWRRLHIEVDSMGESTQNFVGGYFMETKLIGLLGTEVLVSNQDLEPNRFENGRLVSGTRSFKIVGNGDNSVTIRSLSGRGVSVSEGETFQLYDDDDFNASDGLIKDGDTGENISMPDIGFMMANSDNENVNIYASAYIHPVYDIGDNNDNTLFASNVSADSGQAVRDLFDFDQIATEANEEFWTAYLLGGYQYTNDRDADPETELGTVGVTDAQNGVGSIVFMETNGPVECTISPDFCSIADTSAHEIGHLFNADEGDGGIMDGIGHSFSPTSLGKIRRTTHP